MGIFESELKVSMKREQNIEEKDWKRGAWKLCLREKKRGN